jgi:hypothetical protein
MKMKRTCILIGVAAFCSAATAQTSLISPDPIFSRSEGPGFATSFGSYAAGRYQFADGNQRGSSSTLRALCFRHDHRNYNVTNGMGRRWSRVTVQMSEGNLATFGGSFTGNSATVPTQVFSSAVSWPIQIGPSDPLPAGFNIRMPFSTAWAYSGNRDIVTDLRFEGGTLANSAGWSGSTARPYFLDSFFIGSFASGPAVSLGHANGGCVDSKNNSTQAATIRLNMTTYGPNMATPVFRNKFAILTTGRNFNPNSIMILAMAFLANTNGVNVGIPCNQIHLSPLRKWFFYPQTTNSLGQMPPFAFGLSAGLAPYTAQWAGFNLVVQGAWTDSVTGQLKLSSASRNSFVGLPLANVAAVKMKAAYDFNPANATAAFTANGDNRAIPILCYGK